MEFLAIKLLAPRHSLTFVYTHSFYGRVPFDDSLKPACLRENSDQPQYVWRYESLVPILENYVLSPASTKNTLASDTIRRPNENLPTK